MPEKTIQVNYFASLREQRGVNDEQVKTQARTARDLYGELSSRHGFTLSDDMLKVVVNEEFRDWDTALSDGDTVVFVPPVAGG